MGLKAAGGGGEIVQVQGGHIIRATGRKDRHSKVFTAKGPRDRRVRLAAHTAIQFYDVQDRLGYDRPSKAVDWLINKAKASIDKLAELPPWDPIASNNNNNNNTNNNNNNHNDIGGVSNQMCLGGDANDNNSGSSSQFYAPHCVDSQSLGGSMKSFFPTNDTSHENNNDNNNNDALDFQNYPHELISRGTHHNHQDLCLSLHSLNDPGGGASAHHAHPGHDQDLFQGGFDGGWGHHQDVGRFTRLMGWVGDSGGSSVGGEGRGGILFNTNPPSFMSTQALLMNQQGSTMPTTYSHNNQRGTLQSSYSSLTRIFEDNPGNNHSNNSHHDQSMSGMGHGSDSLMGFYIPSQIHGDLHATGASMSNRASSSSLSTDSTQQ